MHTKDSVLICLSDADMCRLVASALESDIVSTYVTDHSVDLSVEGVFWDDSTERWHIDYYLSVAPRPTSPITSKA